MATIHPGFKRRVAGILITLDGLGVKELGVFQWNRSFEEQGHLYTLGRSVSSGICVCAEHPLGKTVTSAQAGDSWHQYGLAADLVFKPKGIWSWDYAGLPYEEMGRCAIALGLAWGGLWLGKKKDPPHVQLTNGLSLWEAKLWYNKGGLQAVWDEVDARGPAKTI